MKLLTLRLLAIAIVCFGLSALTETLMAQEPIVSKSDLEIIQNAATFRRTVMAGATFGDMYIYANGMDYSVSPRTSAELDGNGVEDIVERLLAVPYIYSVTNTNSIIRAGVNMYNAEGYHVASGTIKIGGQSTNRDNYGYGIDLQSWPVLSNVATSWVAALNLKGEIDTKNWWYVQVHNGRVLIREWMCGNTNGVLLGHYTNGEKFAIRLGAPRATIIEPKPASDRYKVQGHHVYMNGEKNMDILEMNHVPSAFVAQPRRMTINVQAIIQDRMGGITAERPHTMVVWDAQGQNSKSVRLHTDRVNNYFFKKPARVDFLFNKFVGYERSFYVPDYNDDEPIGIGISTSVSDSSSSSGSGGSTTSTGSDQ